MNNLGYAALSVLSVLLLLLLWKIHLLRQAARTLREGLKRQRETKSNTLLLALLNLIRFSCAHFSSLSSPLWMAPILSTVSTTPPRGLSLCKTELPLFG